MGRLKGNLGADVFESVLAAEPALVKGLQAILSGTLGGDGTSTKNALTEALIKVGQGLEDLGPKLPGFVDSVGRLADHLGKIVGFLLQAPADKYQSSLPGASLGLDNTTGLGAVLATKPSALIEMPVDAIKAAAKSLWESVTDHGNSSPYNRGAEVGSQVLQGMANGIATGAPTVAAAIKDAAAGVVKAGETELQIKSPSRVFQHQGEMITEGLALGIDEHATMAAHSAANMAELAASESAAIIVRHPDAGALGRAAGDTFNSTSSGGKMGGISFEVHIGEGGSAQDNVEAFRVFVDTELASLLERQLEGMGA
jgi:hypothetical protein